MIPKNTYIRITKLEPVENPDTPAEEGLPNNYWIEGSLLYEIKVDRPLVLVREIRNGQKQLGLFSTSLVKTFMAGEEALTYIITTLNSRYKIEEKEREYDKSTISWN